MHREEEDVRPCKGERRCKKKKERERVWGGGQIIISRKQGKKLHVLLQPIKSRNLNDDRRICAM